MLCACCKMLSPFIVESKGGERSSFEMVPELNLLAVQIL